MQYQGVSPSDQPHILFLNPTTNLRLLPARLHASIYEGGVHLKIGADAQLAHALKHTPCRRRVPCLGVTVEQSARSVLSGLDVCFANGGWELGVGRAGQSRSRLGGG